MINLVSPAKKQQLKAARTNTILANYYVMFVLGVVLLAVVFGIAFYYTFSEIDAAKQQKSQNDLDSQQYADVKKRAAEFEADLAVDKTILASDIRFSQLITDFAAIIPSGVVLNDLTFSAADQGQNKPLNINASSKTYDDAVRLKNSLEESELFQDVKIVSVTTKSSETSGAYPIAVNISAVFNQEATKK